MAPDSPTTRARHPRVGRIIAAFALLLTLGTSGCSRDEGDAGDAPARAGGSGTGDGLSVTRARARVTLPGRTATAGYFDLRNTGSGPAVLVAARSPRIGRIELHRTVAAGDRVRMEPVEAVEVPAGAAVAFEPGGRHLMLLDIEAPLLVDEAFPVVLEFEDGRTVRARFHVVPIGR